MMKQNQVQKKKMKAKATTTHRVQGRQKVHLVTPAGLTRATSTRNTAKAMKAPTTQGGEIAAAITTRSMKSHHTNKL